MLSMVDFVYLKKFTYTIYKYRLFKKESTIDIGSHTSLPSVYPPECQSQMKV